MANQETGTQILARARIKAQDNDANSNFAVSAADALILLNDVLVRLNNNFKTKPKWIGADATGFKFSAGDVTKTGTADVAITEFESFHQATSETLVFPASPGIERVTVQEIMELLNYNGDTALAQAASEWTHVAAEKTLDATSSGIEYWRLWAYPVINRARNIHVKATVPVTIAAIGNYPDVDGVDSRVVSDLLAYEIAKLRKEVSQAFLNNILSGIPRNVLDTVYGGAVRANQLPARVVERNY